MTGYFSTAFFPNILYFSKLLEFDNIKIDVFENFPKQTFRNRCQILSANGVLNVNVPVIHGRSGKIKTKDIKICYSEYWQNKIWQAILSAYASAPFFEHYSYYFLPFFQKETEFLIDYNSKILQTLNKILGIDKKIEFTDDFEKNPENDYRFLISPKIQINESEIISKPYIQVFSDRFEFVPNLSILDLLFNLGPDSKKYLTETIKK